MSLLRYWRVLVGMLLIVAMVPVSNVVFAEDLQPKLTIDNVDDSSFPDNKVYAVLLNTQGFPITTLQQSDFTLAEDKNLVTDFSVELINDNSQPLAIMLAIDTSGSMRGKPLTDAISAAKDFIAKLSQADVVGLVSYADSATVISSPTTDHDALNKALDGLKADGDTALYDAIIEASDELKDRGERKVIILISDGQDSDKGSKLQDALATVTQFKIPVFPIGVGNANEDTLNDIAEGTDGTSQMKEDTEELKSAFDDILNRFRTQYFFSYTSNLNADDTLHTLTLTTTYEGATYTAEAPFTSRPRDLSITMNDLNANDELRGNVVFTPSIVAPGKVVRFEVQIDGKKLDECFTQNCSIDWDSTKGGYGVHEFTFIAEDSVGNKGQQKLSLVIKQPIVITITSPAENARLSGQQEVVFEIDSEYQITSLEAFLNEKSLGDLDPAQRTITIDTKKFEAGAYTLKIIAKDAKSFTEEKTEDVILEVQKSSLILWIALIVLLVMTAIIVPISIRSRKTISKAIPPKGVVVKGNPVLVELAGLSPQQTWPINLEEIRIGRKRDENEIPLKGLNASRRHAIIRCRGGVCTLFSLNPDNPVVVNGSPTAQAILEPGDVLVCGESTFRFERIGY